MPIILLGLGAATIGFLGWRWASSHQAPKAPAHPAPQASSAVDPRLLAVHSRYTTLQNAASNQYRATSPIAQVRATSRYAITPEAPPPAPPPSTPLGGVPPGVAEAMAVATSMGIDPSVAGPLIAQAQAAGIDPLAAIQSVANGVDPNTLAQSFASAIPQVAAPNLSASFGF